MLPLKGSSGFPDALILLPSNDKSPLTVQAQFVCIMLAEAIFQDITPSSGIRPSTDHSNVWFGNVL